MPTTSIDLGHKGIEMRLGSESVLGHLLHRDGMLLFDLFVDRQFANQGVHGGYVVTLRNA